MRRARSAILFVLLAASAAGARPAAAQQPTPTRPPAAPAAAADTLEADSTRFSARGALLRSLVIPGWGQAYVGAPGRGAVYFALEAGSLWMVNKSQRGLRAARELELSLRQSGRLGARQELDLAASRARQVEDWITMSIFLLFFAGADAYVAAQLSDFIEHIGVTPAGTGELRLQARVPVGERR